MRPLHMIRLQAPATALQYNAIYMYHTDTNTIYENELVHKLEYVSWDSVLWEQRQVHQIIEEGYAIYICIYSCGMRMHDGPMTMRCEFLGDQRAVCGCERCKSSVRMPVGHERVMLNYVVSPQNLIWLNMNDWIYIKIQNVYYMIIILDYPRITILEYRTIVSRSIRSQCCSRAAKSSLWRSHASAATDPRHQLAWQLQRDVADSSWWPNSWAM